MITKVKTKQEIAAMRTGGKMLSSVLHLLEQSIKPGMSTKELAGVAATELKALGGQPAFLGYHGFPDVICISLNDEVVHGIPKADRYVGKGDIVSLDLGVTYQGMIVDGAISVLIGSKDDKKTRLLQSTKRSLMAGIAEMRDGCLTGDISAAIQMVLDKGKYGIVRDLVGHGVGHQVHEDPNIPNYGKAGTGFRLQTGMTIAVEPMATLGGYQIVVAPDKWTVGTKDRSLAAHFEHTILINDSGYEILTEL